MTRVSPRVWLAPDEPFGYNRRRQQLTIAMKRKWRILVLVLGGLMTVLIGLIAVVVVAGYQCCNSAADGEAARLADRTPSRNEAAVAAGPDRVALYSVSLRCPLVSSLGCGSESKPIMKKLEAQPGVEGTWLNHSGTSLAVLWKADTDTGQRSQAISAAFQDRDLPGELSGESRDRALRDFMSGIAWYRADAVDELSGQEADAVAKRWVEKISAVVPMPERARGALRRKLSDEMRCRFVNG
jgi:hypothetical protein